MQTDEDTIFFSPELTLSKVLERAMQMGEVRLVNGDEVFTVKHRGEKLPQKAREFLTRGGPVED